ncbi:translocation/assembly module TamB domain-containing protein [Gaoshiqia sediminis]|uniref:Translocation/assembly module TamB n=1 Tax=Gaoshiqia sediminis TaxID=2986998 RepID=A0AA41YBL0_9BACT|nr:translocation/assembly module TamB domain-containing protein [Gaoshiqia sediminis]MCW0481737.1 translocation/assembly module TamB [Gaoshiqia sediminis]
MTGILLAFLLTAYLAFQTSAIQTIVVRQIAKHYSEKLGTRLSVKSVDIAFFNKVILNEVLIEDQQADTLFFIGNLVASIDHFRIKQIEVNLSSLALLDTKIYVSLDENHLPNYTFLMDALRNPERKAELPGWNISCRNFIFNDTRLGYSYYQKEGTHLIDLHNINLDVTDIVLHPDSVSFRINQLSFDDHKSFILNELSTNFVSYKHIIKLNDLKFSTPRSQIANANFIIDQTGLETGTDFSLSQIDLNIRESMIDFRDVGQLVPALNGMDLQMNLSGHIYGTIADLKAKELSVGFGDHTQLTCDFYINGLPNLDEAYLYFDLKNLSTDFRDIAKVRLPDSSAKKYPEIPSMLYDAGIIHYKGNFTGFLSDFVAYGTLRSNFGRMETDLSFIPSANNSLEIKGHLKTVNFRLGKFSQINNLGDITFNGQINGNYQRNRKILTADIDGVVDSVFFRGYRYKNIVLDGQIQEQKFEGDLSIDDQNLKGRFAGKVDLNPQIPVFDFELLLDRANLAALNIDKIHRESDLAVDLKANFSGNGIDNLNGNIWFEEGLYSNENNFLTLNSLTINTYVDSVKNLELRSDYLDANIRGTYSFGTIGQGLKNLLYRYLPASGVMQSSTPGLNKFNLELNIKDAEPITQTFLPNLYLSPAQVFGYFDEAKNKLDIYSEIPQIEYNNLIFRGYSLSIHSSDKLELKSRLEELQVSDGQKLYNLAVLADAQQNNMGAKLIWNNYDEKTYSGELETNIQFSKPLKGVPHVEMNILPTRIYIADSLWNIHPSTISIDSTTIGVNNFRISNQNQEFRFNGNISKDKTARLNMTVNNFNLNNLNLITGQDANLQGLLSGTASVFDVYEKALFLSDLKIDGLRYSGQQVGNVSVLSKWDRPSESVQSELIVNNNNRQTVYGYGSYSPTRDSLDFTLNVENVSLTLLQPVLENTFDNVHGDATGEVKIYGKPEKIFMRGDVYAHNAGLSLGYLQVSYYFSDTVQFRGDSIIFDQITVHDFDGNQGLFDGSIRHDNFSNMDYDMLLRTQKILAINTTVRDNERFYGKAYGNGNLRISGHGRQLYLDGAVRTMNGTSINISLDYEEEAQVYDFLQFLSPKETATTTLDRKLPQQESQVFMNFDIDVTPDARFQLIYNSQIGDMIRAQGSGNLKLEIDPDFNIALYGEYLVDRGDYLFTLQNVINKKFEIEQGGTINWNGDPYNANINLNAIYRLKASLSELNPDKESDQNNPNTPNAQYYQRIPVQCKISLTDNLNNPTIGFGIDFPTIENRIKEEVRQFFSTEEDMNKQILSLLVLGRFYTPEYLRGSYEASNPNVVGSTASELFSNQLSNWLSQISNDFDIGVNYRPGDQISDDEIELALSTQIFNDRVTLNGNIGNNGTQATTANNNNIVGDFDLNVKITNNGKLQFKAYNHSNNNIIYETSPYTQGIGLSYRENYDNFDELWNKFLQLFKRKAQNK